MPLHLGDKKIDNGKSVGNNQLSRAAAHSKEGGVFLDQSIISNRVSLALWDNADLPRITVKVMN